MTVPGVRPIMSSAMEAAIGNLRAPESSGRPALFGGGKRDYRLEDGGRVVPTSTWPQMSCRAQIILWQRPPRSPCPG